MRSQWDLNLRDSVVIACPAPYQLSYDSISYILFKLMVDGLYVCIRVLCPFLFCLSRILTSQWTFFSLLTELRWCLSYVKQTSKKIWRGKECLISRSSTGGARIEAVKSNTQDRTWCSWKMVFYLWCLQFRVHIQGISYLRMIEIRSEFHIMLLPFSKIIKQINGLACILTKTFQLCANYSYFAQGIYPIDNHSVNPILISQ